MKKRTRKTATPVKTKIPLKHHLCYNIVKRTFQIGSTVAILAGLSYGGSMAWGKVFMPAYQTVVDTGAAFTARLAGRKFADTYEESIVVEGALPFKVDPNNPCYLAARYAAVKYAIPQNIIYTVIHHESRGKVDAINSSNKDGSADHGCMQINDKAHPQAFKEKGAMYIAYNNVEYGAQFLNALFKETKDWRKAVVMYNSRNLDKQAVYRKGLNNSAKAIGAPVVVAYATPTPKPPKPTAKPVAAPPKKPVVAIKQYAEAGDDPVAGLIETYGE